MSTWRDELRAAIDEAGDQRPPARGTPHPLHPTLIAALHDIKQALAGYGVPANIRESPRRSGATLDIWSPAARELKITLLLDGDRLRVSAVYKDFIPWLTDEIDVAAETSKDELAGEVVAIYRQFLRRADELNAPEPPPPAISTAMRDDCGKLSILRTVRVTGVCAAWTTGRISASIFRECGDLRDVERS